MKFIKKLTAAALAVIISLAAAVPCFAQQKDDRLYMLGDANLDGKITLSDARKVLRVAAKLEKQDLPITAYDADGNGKLGLSDARIILRYAAKLQKFDYGFDKDGKPNAIAAFKTASYCLDAKMTVEGESPMNVVIAINGSNVYMDLGQFMSGVNITGLLITGEDAYAVGTLSSGKKTLLYIPKESLSEFGSNDELFELSKMLTDYFANDFNDITEITLSDGSAGYRYAYYDESGYTGYTVSRTGRLLSVESGSVSYKNGVPTVTAITSSIEFNSFSANVDKSYFDVNNYIVVG